MGILNVTPDSFSDGGNFLSVENALQHARDMVSEGAAMVDVGGESTRPGASAVSDQEELDRVIPVIEAIHKELDVTISVDTSKALVMREAVNAGAGFINDVRALQEQGAMECVAQLQVPVCLMHMQGEPRTMQASPVYSNVIDDIKAFLKKRAQLCLDAGISKDMVYVDPGIGFGKTLEQNLSILKHLGEFRGVGCHTLIGVSRKSMIGTILNEEVDKRVFGSVALATAAVMAGVSVIRAHDVKAHCDAIRVTEAVMHAN